jgi:hypothetical protein
MLCACASQQRTTNESFGGLAGVPIVVDNTGGQLGSMSIYLTRENGERWRLGSVVGSRVDTLYYTRAGPTGLYQLIADPAGGRRIVSERFPLLEGIVVQWDIGTNSITRSTQVPDDVPPPREDTSAAG